MNSVIEAIKKALGEPALSNGTVELRTDVLTLAVAEVARHHALYLHVDAAWAGSAMICPEFRHLMRGADEADSFVFNPHKWLFTNFDCSAHFVKDPSALTDTLGIRPPFLRTLGKEGFVDYSEWSLPLGRRFRALKLWFVIRSYGTRKENEPRSSRP